MKRSKKYFCLILVLSIILSSVFVGTASAAAVPFKSDTNGNFSLVKGKTYTFKLTPTNPKSVVVFSSANSKELQVVSNIKKGSSYYATIKAVGTIGSQTGVYAAIKGQRASRLCVVTIGKTSLNTASNTSSPLPDPHQWDNYIPPDDNYLSIINDPEYGTGPHREAATSSVLVNGIISSLPEDISIEQGTTIQFDFDTIYDLVNYDPNDLTENHGVTADRVPAPDISFSDPDVISYDHGLTVGSTGVGSTVGPRRSVEITAEGEVGDMTDVYSTVFGIKEKQCTITIGPKGSVVQGDGILTEKPTPQPRIAGLYGITEVGKDDEGYVWEHPGVLVPLVHRYNSSKDYDGQALNLNGNLVGIDLFDHTITISNRWDAVADFKQQNGKFGLGINWWRHSREDDASINTALNGVLTAFCFLSNDKMAGESLWAWWDARNTAQGVKVTDYGFTDSNPTGMIGTLTYKDGTTIDYNEQSGGYTEFYFTPKP